MAEHCLVLVMMSHSTDYVLAADDLLPFPSRVVDKHIDQVVHAFCRIEILGATR